jgi:glycosyltransferase involved in cell wall biosynthesis
MRILLIVARYLPHRGGLESVVYHLAQEFQSGGHVVQIITARYPRTLPAHEIISGFPVERLHFIQPLSSDVRAGRPDLFLAGLWFGVITPLRLQARIRSFQPDVVNAHYLYTPAWAAAALQPKLKFPLVVSFHGGDVDGEPFRSKLNRRKFSQVCAVAAQLTACSQSLAAQAAALEPGIQPRLSVIHNGVDLEKFSRPPVPPLAGPYILAVGQMAAHKGFDLLLEAFAAAAPRYPQVRLVLAGEGAQRPILEALAAQLNLGQQVLFTGRINEEQVAAWMGGCLFLAVPSRREPFGMVALEGMAAGKVVLAAPVGGIPEFLPIPPNRLVQLNFPDWQGALVETLEQALAGRLDGAANREHARQHSWNKVAGDYLAVYQKALSANDRF